MLDNINDDILDLHLEETMELMDIKCSGDQNHALLEEDAPGEEIDQLNGIPQSNSDGLIVSQFVHAVNRSSLDELPIPN